MAITTPNLHSPASNAYLYEAVRLSVVDALRLKLKLLAEPLLDDLADKIASNTKIYLSSDRDYITNEFKINVLIKDYNGKETI